MIAVRAAEHDEYPIAPQLRGEMEREFGGDFDARSSDWRTRYSRYFYDLKAAGKSQLYLAFDGDEAIGMALVSYEPHYRTEVFGTRFAYINGVFVRPAYRRRGIARQLVEACIAWAREHRCETVRLRASAGGRPLYASLGFEQTSEMFLKL